MRPIADFRIPQDMCALMEGGAPSLEAARKGLEYARQQGPDAEGPGVHALEAHRVVGQGGIEVPAEALSEDGFAVHLGHGAPEDIVAAQAVAFEKELSREMWELAKIMEAKPEMTVTVLSEEERACFRDAAAEVEATFIEMTGDSGAASLAPCENC